MYEFDIFPHTAVRIHLPLICSHELSRANDVLSVLSCHVETVVLLGRELEKSREHVYLDYEPSKEIDLPGGATYEQIKAYVLEHTGLKVSHLYIAQVKQKHGIIERECYNKPKSEDAKQPQCPPEKEAAIEAALKHFKMI